MKTYLSRLVARAQPIGTPVAISPRPSFHAEDNPFESIAPAAPEPPNIGAAAPPPDFSPATPRPAPEAATRIPPRATPSEIPISDSSLRNAPAPRPVAHRSPARIDPPTAQASPHRTPHREELPAAKPRQTAARATTATPGSIRLEPAADVPPPMPHGPTPTEIPARASDEKLVPPRREPAPTATPTLSPDDAAVRLQRAADTFMAQFSRRAESLLAPPVGRGDASEVVANPPAPNANVSAHKLAPAAAPAPEPSAPATPSVVIGRVSVEVVPPSPPTPTTPASSRARPARPISRSLPAPRSSARFGLGQL